MSKLLILKGLPASGKTQFALELVKKGFKRVNKDSLRDMIDGGKWSREKEKTIMEMEVEIVCRLLNNDFNVVVDDTNFGWEEKWEALSKSYLAEFEVKFFDVSLTECIERDSKRGDKSVGAEGIQRMYDKYLKPQAQSSNPELENCYIFDIDGTLAKMNGRSPYDYSLVHTDLVNKGIIKIYRDLEKCSEVSNFIIVSGRTDDCKDATVKWLRDNGINFTEIHMRKYGDVRNDSIVKKEIFDNYIKDKYNTIAVFARSEEHTSEL